MERIIRLSYTNKATIPTGVPYENQSPCYTMTQEMTVENDQTLIEHETKLQLDWMKEFINSMVNQDFKTLRNCAKKEFDLSTQRITEIEGVKFPHVSNIITPDTPPIPNIDDYAELGTAIHLVWDDYISFKQLIYRDFEDKGRIKRTFDSCFQAISDFLDTTGDLEFFGINEFVVNDIFNYCGTYDAHGKYCNELALFDFKTFENKNQKLIDKYFMQLAAYEKALNVDMKYLVVISPHFPPFVTENKDEYFQKFLVKRMEYKERFGV